MNKKIQIGVMGPDEKEYPEAQEIRNKISKTAENLGQLIAKKNAVLFTGGCGGVM